MTNQEFTRRSFLFLAGSTAILAAAGASGLEPLCSAAVEKEAGAFLHNWFMQAADIDKRSGAELSTSKAGIEGWYPVTIPSTVLAGLVANGEYADLFFADNFKKVPEARFKTPWWFRKEFELPAESAGRQIWLYFKGINYRADIWLNGKKIADCRTVVGAYRDFQLNITAELAGHKGTNALAVQVFPPVVEKDLAITFVDWAPAPPDQNMGLWQDVELRTSGPVAIRYPHVVTDLDLPSARAELTVLCDLVNPTGKEVTGRLDGEIEGLKFSRKVTLGAGKTKTVSFSPVEFRQLIIKNPRIWWPWQLGSPEMYDLKLSFFVDEKVSDSGNTSFGIRKVASRLFKTSAADEDQSPRRIFSVNDVDLLVLGAGYAPDLLQRRVMSDRPGWQEDHIRYVRDMNLNAVRLEGKLEDDAFYDLCDRYGILVLAGWCCCSPWERWKIWKDEQHRVARESLRYQMRRARTHPSMLVWLNGSDFPPPADVEQQYLAIERELKWPCPQISSATGKKTSVSEPTGVKMKGPYKWEPPIYWLTDRKAGGAWGFNTEVGPGPVPPPLESLQKMLPKEHYWPIDDMWNFHCGRMSFGDLRDFTEPLDARFGKSRSIADFSWKAQAQAYETMRAMFEGFRRNEFRASGEIQWMLNNAWPSLIWHLYDYYLRPGGAYFATKLACEPLHILYSYDNRSVVIVNDALAASRNLTARAEIFDIKSASKYRQNTVCDAAANAPTVAFTLPELSDISTTYFLRLTLTGASGELLSVNSYWLSTRPDVMKLNDAGKEAWNIMHVAAFTDYRQLEKLPSVNLTLTDFAVERQGAEDEARVLVANKSSSIALLVRLKLSKKSNGEEILPVRFDDNYFMLLPGEQRRVKARYLAADGDGNLPVASVDCFNNGRG